jgi:hypothetical protein
MPGRGRERVCVKSRAWAAHVAGRRARAPHRHTGTQAQHQPAGQTASDARAARRSTRGAGEAQLLADALPQLAHHRSARRHQPLLRRPLLGGPAPPGRGAARALLRARREQGAAVGAASTPSACARQQAGATGPAAALQGRGSARCQRRRQRAAAPSAPRPPTMPATWQRSRSGVSGGSSPCARAASLLLASRVTSRYASSMDARSTTARLDRMATTCGRRQKRRRLL